MLSEKKKADLFLFITASGWALSTILIKVYIDSIPIFHLLFGRYLLAFLMMAIFQGSKLKTVKKEDVKPSIVLGTLMFLAYAFAVASLSFTSASKSGFLVALSVLFVPIATTIINKRLPKFWTLVSIAMSIMGLFLISGLNGGAFNIGDFLAIMCSVSYTIYILVLDRQAKIIEENKLVLLQLLVVAMISFVLMLLLEGFDYKVLLDGFVPIFVIALFGSALASFAQTKAQKHASPESVGLILLGEPLFTLLMAAFILKEPLMAKGLIGAGLLLMALVITVLKDK